MVDAGERAIREAILRGEDSNDNWRRLVEMLAAPLMKKIRDTFYYYTFSSNEQECEDVLQTTFYKLIERLDQCDPERPLLPWAKTIAQHEVINVLRERSKQWRAFRDSAPPKDRSQVASPGPDDQGQSQAGSEEARLDIWEIGDMEAQQDQTEEAESSYAYDYGDDAAELARNKKSEIFRNELALLSDLEQTIIIEHYQSGRPLVDLAREKGITPEAMRQRASRTRRKLFERLVQHDEFQNLKKLHESAARQKK